MYTFIRQREVLNSGPSDQQLDALTTIRTPSAQRTSYYHYKCNRFSLNLIDPFLIKKCVMHLSFTTDQESICSFPFNNIQLPYFLYLHICFFFTTNNVSPSASFTRTLLTQ